MVQSRLKNVKALCCTWAAFAAIVGDGSVVCWGHASNDFPKLFLPLF